MSLTVFINYLFLVASGMPKKYITGLFVKKIIGKWQQVSMRSGLQGTVTLTRGVKTIKSSKKKPDR